MAHVRRRQTSEGGRFDVCWREFGRHRSRTFSFRKDADRFRVEVERRVQLGDLYEAPPITLGAAHQSWRERWQIGKASSTVTRKDEAWPHVQCLEDVPLTALTRAALEDAITAAALRAPRQAQLALDTVKQVLRDARARGQRINPALLDVRAPGYEEREPVFLTAREVDDLASWSSEPRIIQFAAFTGLRLGELLALRDGEVDLNEGAYSLSGPPARGLRAEPRRERSDVSTSARLPCKRSASNC
jgi:integrase